MNTATLSRKRPAVKNVKAERSLEALRETSAKADAAIPALQFPLTRKALQAAFAKLHPENIELTKNPRWHEAEVQGAWTLPQIRARLRALGFVQTGEKNALAFVNDEKTVGVVLQGAVGHINLKLRTWTRFTIEVCAQPLSAVRKEGAETRRKMSYVKYEPVTAVTGL